MLGRAADRVGNCESPERRTREMVQTGPEIGADLPGTLSCEELVNSFRVERNKKMRLPLFRRKFGFCLSLTVVIVCASARGDEPSKDVPLGEALILPPAGRGG